MSINLTKTLKAKQAESKLSNEALAKAIGVSTVSVTGVLKGKSKPNATTAKKYADYLGIDPAELIGSKPRKQTKKTKKAAQQRTPKAGKRTAKAGRKVSAKGLGAELISAVSVAAEVLNDHLAIAVHQAGKSERDLIGRLLGV